jgi:hypothetical protein
MSQNYKIGKIQAGAVAIGPKSRAKHITAMQTEALHQIRQLIELLSVHADEIDSPGEVQADAESVEAALRKKKLNRVRIENLIAKIAPAVAGVTALANAVDAVQTAVTHLFT